jgi:hypothetical protein
MSKVRALPAKPMWPVGARVADCGGSSDDGSSVRVASPANGSRKRFDTRGAADHEQQLAKLWRVG